MKELKKLNINSEKIMSPSELEKYKGGDWCGTCTVYYEGGSFSGPGCGNSCQEAQDTCSSYYHSTCDCGCSSY